MAALGGRSVFAGAPSAGSLLDYELFHRDARRGGQVQGAESHGQMGSVEAVGGCALGRQRLGAHRAALPKAADNSPKAVVVAGFDYTPAWAASAAGAVASTACRRLYFLRSC